VSKKQTRRAIIDAAIAKKYGWGFGRTDRRRWW